MRTRIGIELSPADCRIVEIEPPAGARQPFLTALGAAGRTGSRAGTNTRICSYSVSPRASGEARTQLARLRGREAAVVAWGLRGDHRQAVVTADRYDAMRQEALNSLRFAGIDTRGVLSDIAPAGPRRQRGQRRPVVMALAAKIDVATAIRPLVAAGIRIRSIVTPAAALCSVARLRRGQGATAGVEAYVALEETATCIALVQDQILVAARELPWGYVHEDEPFGQRVPRDKIAMRLAGALVDFFSAAGVELAQVCGVCICGSLPELRTMTAPIMERLDIEIEPLDSMFGIEGEELREAVADVRERAVEIRLAWAAAADWTAPLNLLRDRQRLAAAAVFSRAAVVAGIGAGVGLGWWVQQTAWLEAAVQTPAAPRAASAAPPAPAVDRPPGASGTPEVARELRSPRHAEPLARRELVVAASAEPPAIVGEPAVTAVAIQPPPIMHEPVVGQAPLVENARPVAPPASVAREVVAAPRPPEPPPVEHVDLDVGSILFGPERKLAMIDGRIVEAGDQVRGSLQVIDVSPTSVTLRDGVGRLRRLSLGKGGP